MPPVAAQTWIFQANPQYYDIDQALQSLPEMAWLVSSHREQIRPGDKVFLWRSGPDAAIVAEASVLAPASAIDASEKELEFALQKDKFSGPQTRVPLRIEEVFEPPLTRDALKADVRLTNLSILRFPQGTNFAVAPEEAAIIRELLGTHRASDDDITGGAGAVRSGIGSRVWAYAPGRRAEFWEEFYREEIMAIGWDDLGDLRYYPDHDTIAEKLIEVYGLKGYPINDSRACYDFLQTMKPGDRVFAKRGRDEVVRYGLITGDYEYRPERAIYRHVRQVRWERRGNWKSKSLFAVKTLTDFTSYQDTVKYLEGSIGVLPPHHRHPQQRWRPTPLKRRLKEWRSTRPSLRTS